MYYKEIFEDENNSQSLIELFKELIINNLNRYFINNIFVIEKPYLFNKIMEDINTKLLYKQPELELEINDMRNTELKFNVAIEMLNNEHVINMTYNNQKQQLISLTSNNNSVKSIIQQDSNIINNIKQKCSDIINVYKSTELFLYRGMNREKKIFFGKIRENRKPLDTPQSLQSLVDELLTKQGFKAIRNNSLFCTSNAAEAGLYGNTYIIFPINGFDFTYWKKSEDLFQSINIFLDNNGKHGFPSKSDRTNVSRSSLNLVKNNIAQIINDLQPSNDNIKNAIYSSNEIMIANCDYYAIQYRYFDFIKNLILN